MEETDMAVRILTDSASDITQTQAAAWGIRVLPLKVRFGEEEYLDGVNLMPRDFYSKLIETDEVPKTSQITPYEYDCEYKAAAEAGDELICFTMSSGVSGCYQSACLAAQAYETGIHVLDTRQFCISEYIIVQRAVQLRDEGKTAAEIIKQIQEEQNDAHVIAVFNTLEYLKLGGRLSAAAAAAGNLLAIKPVLTIEEGAVKIIGKARGSRKGNNLLSESVVRLGGIDFDRPVCLAYSGFSDEVLRKYMQDSAYLYKGFEDRLQIAEVGATIGTYSGPDAIALAFFAKKRED